MKLKQNPKVPVKRPSYLTCSVRVEYFVFDDEPQVFPWLLAALGSVKVTTHGGVFCVCGYLEREVPRASVGHRLLFKNNNTTESRAQTTSS